MSQFIPTAHNERNFRQYESVLTDCVERWPKDVIVDPLKYGYARDTVAHRIRQAKVAFSRYAFSPTTIDREKFDSLSPIITVGYTDDGMVRIGPPKPRAHRVASVKSEPALSDEIINLNLVACDIGAIRCLCLVAANDGLRKRIRLPQLLNGTAERLEAEYDVALTRQEDGTYLLR